jgi:deoxyhypusine monooxygenase
MVEAEPATIASLKSKLVDPSTPLPDRYRAMFSLRNVAGQEAHEALVAGKLELLPTLADLIEAQHSVHIESNYVDLPFYAALKDESNLFRHDVAFCLGQRQDPAAIEVLTSLLRDHTQHGMYVASECRVFSRETWARPNACTHRCPHHPMKYSANSMPPSALQGPP